MENFELELKYLIDENKECVRCGACCVYPLILNDDGTVFKEAGEVCDYMGYDFKSNLANCAIHDNDEKRPKPCSYKCSSNMMVLPDLETGLDLMATAKLMPKIMRKHKHLKTNK